MEARVATLEMGLDMENQRVAELEAQLKAPTKLDEVDASLEGFAGIYLPGGHGAAL